MPVPHLPWGDERKLIGQVAGFSRKPTACQAAALVTRTAEMKVVEGGDPAEPTREAEDQGQGRAAVETVRPGTRVDILCRAGVPAVHRRQQRLRPDND